LDKPHFIQRVVAFVLFIALAISVTPKSFIHDALADHDDSANFCAHKTHKDLCITKAGINCHFTNLVVALPYTGAAQQCAQDTDRYFHTFIVYPASAIFHPCFNSKEGRGPPDPS
jgi:hypothetical protein